jgi:hypothetical protein
MARPGRKLHPQWQEKRAYARHQCQARFRHEAWEFTWEEWWALWQPKWHLRGRDRDGWCMARRDPDLPWTTANVVIINRRDWLHEMVRIGGEFSQWRGK